MFNIISYTTNILVLIINKRYANLCLLINKGLCLVFLNFCNFLATT